MDLVEPEPLGLAVARLQVPASVENIARDRNVVAHHPVAIAEEAFDELLDASEVREVERVQRHVVDAAEFPANECVEIRHRAALKHALEPCHRRLLESERLR